MTQHVLYVPQGRTARLDTAVDSQFTGLYTDNFSACNIIVITGKSRMVLAHADRNLASIAPCLAADIDWVGEGASMSIYYRGHNVITEILLLKFGMMNLAITPSFHTVTSDVDGIQIEKDSSRTFKLNFIQDHQNLPFSLAHHPQETPMETVQKLRQLFGLREEKETGLRLIKQVNIFDGIHWVPVPRNELQLVSQHPLTQNEMSRFAMGELLDTIYPKMHQLILEIFTCIKAGNSVEETCDHLVPLLELYLNNYDSKAIVLRHIQHLAQILRYPAQRVEVIDSLETAIAFLSSLIKNFKKIPASDNRDTILSTLLLVHKHAQERMHFKKISEQQECFMGREKNLRERAVLSFREGQYASAKPLALSALKLAIVVYTADNPLLSSAYYNLGRCLQETGEHESALEYLHQALKLREQYADKANIDKTSKALAVSKEHLAQSWSQDEQLALH
ncbi:tetratricopeptide repeat protein [Legionella shakespearei]|uniref:Tetratricopeptide repeat protein n=1 Tax=Legionella shakespearei DSM 23087 TaxID=1122169 RepID=A0A0W0ZAA8_9GAMM|nr:tetratricopeptide repeat protein [Legionella shakespearei]KTD66069.1 Tetratricopeptide repeat protein [Legionella shakespearei DSM 23087]